MLWFMISVHIYFMTDEPGLGDFAKKRLMINVINTLKKDFGYEILFLKTTIDLNANVKYVKLQHILHKCMNKRKKHTS